jgi:hypothetical protein
MSGPTITVGVDIGQSRDPTAIVVIRSYRDEPEPVAFEPGGPLPDALKPPGSRVYPEVHHQVIHMDKLRLGTPYPGVVERVSHTADWANQYGRPTVVIDNTGIGRAVTDLLREGCRHQVRAVTITSGTQAKRVDAYTHNLPKSELVGALQVVMQTDRLKAVPDIRFTRDLFDELVSFDFTKTDAGNDTFEAASGHHDDLVIALALGVWWAERHQSGQGHAFLEAWRRRGQKQRAAGFL